MSTEKANIQAQRFALLSRLNEKIFHVRDLQTLWVIKDQNTLHTTLKRYVQAELLYRVYRGLYSLLPPHELDPLILGAKALHEYCYLSTETVLFRDGYISQKPQRITYISSQSRKFSIGQNLFTSRRLIPQFLMNPLGIQNVKGIIIASPLRAIADILYYNPRFHFDAPVDWKKVKKLQTALGYPLTPSRYAPAKT